jgi:hypothetical protein
MNFAELAVKFRGLTEGIVTHARQDHIVEVCTRLEEHAVSDLWR